MKPQKLIEQMQHAQIYMAMQQHADTMLMREAHKSILSNVYREFYDIPPDLKVRKSDPAMRHAVANSEAY